MNESFSLIKDRCTTCGGALPCVLHDREMKRAMLGEREEPPTFRKTWERNFSEYQDVIRTDHGWLFFDHQAVYQGPEHLKDIDQYPVKRIFQFQVDATLDNHSRIKINKERFLYPGFKEEFFWDHTAGQWSVRPYRFLNKEIENGLVEVVPLNEREMIVIYKSRISGIRSTAIAKAVIVDGICEYQTQAKDFVIEEGIAILEDETFFVFLDGSAAYFIAFLGVDFSSDVYVRSVFSSLNFSDYKIHLKSCSFGTRIIRLSDRRFIINASTEIHLLDISSSSDRDQILDFGSREYNPGVGVLTPTSFVVSTKDNKTLMIFSEDRNGTWQVRELGVAGISAQRIEVIDKESFYIFDSSERVEYWEIPIEERQAFHERHAAQTTSPSLPSDI